MKKLSFILLCFICVSSLFGQTDSPMPAEDQPLNSSNSADAYSWLSKDGLRIYYSRENSTSELWRAERKKVTDDFMNPVSVTIDGLTGDDEVFSCWLTQDEQTVYFVTHQNNNNYTTTLFRAAFNKSTQSFVNPIKINLMGIDSMDNTNIFISGPSLTPDLSQLFVYYNNEHSSDQIACFNSLDGINYVFKSFLGDADNYSPGSLANDGLSYYLTISKHPNLLAKFSRPHLSSEFGLPEYFILDTLVNGKKNYIQPSINEDLGIASFTLGDGSWSGNDLVVIPFPANKLKIIPFLQNIQWAVSDSVKSIELLERETEIDYTVNPTPVITQLKPSYISCFFGGYPIDTNLQIYTSKANQYINEDTLLFDPLNIRNAITTNLLAESLTLEAFPNPAATSFKIIYDFKSNNADGKRIIMVNQTGQRVRQLEVNGNSGSIDVDVSDLAEGIYYYYLFSEHESSPVKKLVVNH